MCLWVQFIWVQFIEYSFISLNMALVPLFVHSPSSSEIMDSCLLFSFVRFLAFSSSSARLVVKSLTLSSRSFRSFGAKGKIIIAVVFLFSLHHLCFISGSFYTNSLKRTPFLITGTRSCRWQKFIRNFPGCSLLTLGQCVLHTQCSAKELPHFCHMTTWLCLSTFSMQVSLLFLTIFQSTFMPPPPESLLGDPPKSVTLLTGWASSDPGHSGNNYLPS